MIPWWGLAVLILGANFALWGSAGLCRLTGIRVRRLREHRAARRELRRAVKAAKAAAAGKTAKAPAAGKTLTAAEPGLPAPGTPGPGTAGPGTPGPAGPGMLEPAGPGAPEPAGPGAPEPVAAAPSSAPPPGRRLTVADVAVLIPAHNEAVVIGDSLRAIMALVPGENVHVVSDGSTDDTERIAREYGANVMRTSSNVGKAGALQQAISRFRLTERFAVVMLLDADTRVQPGYFDAALPMFADPEVVAVAGCVRTARERSLSLVGNVLVGHRQRIYAIGQRVLKFGQTWTHTNATHIVPGFASMYRTEVLPLIDMNPPGLVIEDFNMTFEVYQKRLGKVGFTLSAVAVTQDPDNLGDYIRQTKRWAIGLWQTVRRHPPRANLFTVMLALLLLELVTSSLLYLLFPLLLVVLAMPDLVAGATSWPGFAEVYGVVASHLTLTGAALGVLAPDIAITCVVAVIDRQPRLLALGVFFPLMRLLDAAVGLYAVPAAWLRSADGHWKSPARRPGVAGGVAGQSMAGQGVAGAEAGGAAGAAPARQMAASPATAGLAVVAITAGGQLVAPAFAGEVPHASV
jgi:poly-beta-1,6-N-acetyl-D-glucosamine synthase